MMRGRMVLVVEERGAPDSSYTRIHHADILGGYVNLHSTNQTMHA